MSEVEHGGDCACDERAKNERSTRRHVLAALSAVGAAGVLPGTVPSPAAAEPDSERPKENDLSSRRTRATARASCRSSLRIFRLAVIL